MLFSEASKAIKLLLNAFKCLQGQAHQEACDKAHILHRDISIGNIVLWEGNGYLIDWERAKKITDPKAPRAKDRTGTWQFMSIRLLKNLDHHHEIRDDIESFVYVMAYSAICYAKNDMEPSDRMFYLQRFDQNDEAAASSRRHVITSELQFELTTEPFSELLDDLASAVGYLYLRGHLLRKKVKPEDGQSIEDAVAERKSRLLTHTWMANRLKEALADQDWLNSTEKDWVENIVSVPRTTSSDSPAAKRRKNQVEYAGLLSSYWVSDDPDDPDDPLLKQKLDLKPPVEKCMRIYSRPLDAQKSTKTVYLPTVRHLDSVEVALAESFSKSLTPPMPASNIIEQLDSLVALDFPTLAPASNNQFFLVSRLQINQLREAAWVLSPVDTIRIKVTSSLKSHDTLPSDSAALITIRNLKTLYGCISRRRVAVESALWKALDDNPHRTEAKLRALVDQVFEDVFDGKLRYVTLSSFQTLGVGRWLDDEVVNYFVSKWCSESGTTLGLSTFFATKFLFECGTCNPKGGILTEADENSVDNLGLKSWDSVYIPINENRAHWYSARIDFLQKRIDIYDSLRDRCIENRQKPPLLRKNAKLMLILMWLTEVLSRLRGDEVQLQNKLGSGWVHFQPNAHDCGVHMLWHLRHILEFRQIRLGVECSPVHLRFTDNMVGKRLRLAQEIAEDSGLA
ncbi:hypothetical protein D9757_014334 [Collybiopsis confluens]|uniref:Uncharacterized protein n=1 Tax=Collybiopsis confluens TaxID=2823264 RepID=A0A8H5D6D8_9AGAR|nr:hypothetical protein D9757_014334 [Collybiopsis confluens]